MSNILSVVGNRPQLIKMAPLSQLFVKRGIKESILHSGQHYDFNLNGQFFQELNIPEPYKVLKLGTNLSHATMTGQILEKVEEEIKALQPKFVMVYGDTNTTLAATLAAVKLRTPVVHVEAGPRIYDLFNPEEINRKCVDHSSSVNLCPDELSVQNLTREGLADRSYFVGDLMHDIFLKVKSTLTDIKPDDSVFVTIHRPENTDVQAKLTEIMSLLRDTKRKVYFAVHPRTEAKLKQFGLWDSLMSSENIKLLPPLGYTDTVRYICQAAYVITDSGGLQKEAYWAQKPTVFYFHTSPWPLLKSTGWQLVAGDVQYSPAKILEFFKNFDYKLPQPNYFGAGDSAEKIVQVLTKLGFLE